MVLELLKDCGVTYERIQEESSWYDITFADKFFDEVIKRTGDQNIAYNCGLYIKQDSFSSAVYYLIRGLVKVGRLYQLISKVTPRFTKAATMKVLKFSKTEAHLESIPNDGHTERLYMCQNRMGILTGIPTIFGMPHAHIDHPECLHKGGNKCVYNVTWKEKSSSWWFLGMVLSTAASMLVGFKFFNNLDASLITVATFFISFSLYMTYRFRFQRGELNAQNDNLQSAVKDIEQKNYELNLVGKISKMTHSLTTPEELGKTLVKSVVDILEYDRAILLTVDRERNVLKVTSCHGYSEKLEEMMTQTEFNIDPTNTTGFFVKVVNTNNPVLITNVAEHIKELSARSQKFAKILGAQSFVAVPLRDEHGYVIGVLSVDYMGTEKTMSPQDEDLMMTLSEHLGISLHNSKMVKKLEDNLEVQWQYSRQQKSLREVFQKFVPTDLASDLMDMGEGNHSGLVNKVKKTPVSIIFADIFDFSKLSNELASEDVVSLLNISFNIMEPIIRKHGGFIDKFTGDGFLAVFEHNYNEIHACRAAEELIEKMKLVNAHLRAKSYPDIAIGLGIHHGDVILGNVGSNDRLNFTVIGDTVNLAARLEAHTRNLGKNTICCSSTVHKRAAKEFKWLDLGSVAAKGFANGVHAYQLSVSEEKILEAKDEDDKSSKQSS
jgi:adenylate cyclase